MKQPLLDIFRLMVSTTLYYMLLMTLHIHLMIIVLVHCLAGSALMYLALLATV